jgi:hypothetical protein
MQSHRVVEWAAPLYIKEKKKEEARKEMIAASQGVQILECKQPDHHQSSSDRGLSG